MPRIAVVVPLYNHSAFIEATIGSVLGQTRPADRFIMVDDGSTDGSAELVEKMAVPGLELFRQTNQGAHAALNRGVALADDCDWIAILNSDDLFAPTRLERGLEVLAQRPRTEMLCTSLHLIDDEGQPLPETSAKVRRLREVRELVLSHPDPLTGLGISNFAKTTSNFIASRHFLLDHPFPAYRYVHDYHAILSAGLEGKLSILPEDLLGYRIHGTNTIKSGGKSAVIAETLQMNLDLLGAYAEPMRTSPEMRKRWRLYLQRLLGNHTDFRGELFIQLIANVLATQPGLFSLDSLADFPELDHASAHLPQLPAIS